MKVKSMIALGVLLAAALAAGCLEINNIRQPDKVTTNAAFQIRVNFSAVSDSGAIPYNRFGGIKLPPGFVVTKAAVGGNDIWRDSTIEARITQDYPPEPGYYWWAASRLDQNSSSYEAVLDIQANDVPGPYLIDYVMGLYSSFDLPLLSAKYEDTEMDLPLEVLADADQDRLPDAWENAHACVDVAAPDAEQDPDLDLVTNLVEYEQGTNPCNPDTDGDDMDDSFEIQYYWCVDPLAGDSQKDPDADGLSNLEEYVAHSNPCIFLDGMMASAWPTDNHDPQRTSRASVAGPDIPSLLWSTTLAENVDVDPSPGWNSDPIIGPGQKIYIPGNDGIMVVDPVTKTASWLVQISSISLKGLTLGEDGTMYGAGPGALYAFDPLGNIRWTYPVSGNATTPVIGQDGTIYFTNSGSDSHVIALDSGGTLKWRVPFGEFNMYRDVAIGPDGTIYAAGNYSYDTTSDVKVVAINPEGTVKWEYVAQKVRLGDAGPMVGPDGSVTVPYRGGWIVSLNPADGSVKWLHRTHSYCGNHSPWIETQAMGKDGTVYFIENSLNAGTCQDKWYLNAISPDGAWLWQVKTSDQNYTPSDLTVDDEGRIYVYAGSWNNPDIKQLIYIFSPQGQVLSKIDAAPFGPISDMVIAPGGMIYTRAKRLDVGQYGYFFLAFGELQPPTGLSYTPLDGAYVKLNFNPSVSLDAASYNVYSDNGTGVVDYSTPVGTITHPNGAWTSPTPLDPDQIYLFSVRTVDTEGNEETNTTTVLVIPKVYVTIPVPAWASRVRVTLLEASAGFPSEVWIAEPQVDRLIKNSLRNIGKVTTTTLLPGDDLMFFIRVHAESWGLGVYDHYSDTIYAHVWQEGPSEWTIGFEDLPESSWDQDYNDVVILVELLPDCPEKMPAINFMGELEMATSTGDSGNVVASLNDPKGFNTEISVPRAALISNSSIILTNGEPELYDELMAQAPFTPIGVFRKATLTNGQEALSTPATIAINYPDADQNGFVDGTGIIETGMAFYCYDEDKEAWTQLDTNVDQAHDRVSAPTSHFSLFALGIAPSASQQGSSRKSANSGNWFGCSLTSGAAPAAGLANLAVMALVALPALMARAGRRRKK